MRKSWTKPGYIGYEIKVSRSDFLSDTKWPAYLPSCNELWFVCPSGLIRPDEVPEQVGLLWVSKTGTRLYSKKKAVFREIDPPVALLHYALMRANSFDPLDWSRVGRERSAEYWRQWMERRADFKELGGRASKSIRRRYDEDVETVKRENERLKREIGKFESLVNWMDTNGIRRDESLWTIRHKIERLIEGGSLADLADAIGQMERAAATVKRKINEARNGG